MKQKSAVRSNDDMSLVYTTSYPEIISLLPWALKGAPVITVSMYSWWRHFSHVNAVRRRHYGINNVNNQCVFSHASWK